MTLPANWNRTNFGEVLEVLDRFRVPVNSAERSNRQGEIPYYGATGQVGWIDDYLFDEELILLGEDGAPFLEPAKPKAYMIRGKSWVNNHAHVLRANGGMSNSFFMYQLNALDYRPYVSGTTRLKLPQAPMLTMPLVVPPLAEQHRIVAEIEQQLTRLDAAVGALRRVQANLKRYRASVLKAAVEGQLVDGSSGEWDYQQLGEFVVRSEYGTSTKCDYAGEGLPVLRIPNVVGGHIELNDLKFAIGDLRLAESTELTAGDMLVIRTNGSIGLIGKTAVVGAEIQGGKYYFASYLLRFRFNEAISPEWVHVYLGSPQGRAYIESRAASSAGQHNINLKMMHSLMIPVPSLSEQAMIIQEVERRLSLVDSLEETVEHALPRSDRMRQSVLKRAFEGKLVPQDPDDEPAKDLLERIRAERAPAAPVRRGRGAHKAKQLMLGETVG